MLRLFTGQDQSVYSSITPGTLHPRLSQLEKCINEANWRYKLVTTTEGVVPSLEDSTLSCSDEHSICTKWEREISFGTETQSSSDLEFSNDEDEIEPGIDLTVKRYGSNILVYSVFTSFLYIYIILLTYLFTNCLLDFLYIGRYLFNIKTPLRKGEYFI